MLMTGSLPVQALAEFSHSRLPQAITVERVCSPSKQLCVVCGDDSTGYHYEVPSCNGCKTFFRRTIVTKRTFKCHKNGDCHFSKEHRCACRSCRFNKCLEVGMNPNAIQASRYTPELTVTPAASCSIDSCNRKKSYNICSLLDIPSSSSTMTSRSSSPSEAPNPNPFKTKSCHKELVDRTARLAEVEEAMSYLRKSTYKPILNLVDILTLPCALENISLYELRSQPFEVNWDEELSIQTEYAKTYQWFREMHIEEKLVFLVDRLFYVAVMHVAAEMAKSDALIDVNNCLRVTIAAMRRIAIDPVAFALLNAVVFSDCASSYLCERTIAHLREERERNVEALGLHLFERYQAEGASRMADHLSLIWSLLNDCCALRRHLLSSLPPSSFTSHILSLRTRFT